MALLLCAVASASASDLIGRGVRLDAQTSELDSVGAGMPEIQDQFGLVAGPGLSMQIPQVATNCGN